MKFVLAIKHSTYINLCIFLNADNCLQAFHSLAKCVAAIMVTRQQEAVGVVNTFLGDIQNPRSDPQHMFALLVVGEIGRHIDLSGVANLKQVILASFSPPSEEVKSAASYALGSIAVGNLQQYLPFVLQEIESQPKRQYLLLHSLKEVSFFILF